MVLSDLSCSPLGGHGGHGGLWDIDFETFFYKVAQKKLANPHPGRLALQNMARSA